MSSGQPPSGSGYQVGPGMWTVVGYRVFDADGEAVDNAVPELGFVFGYGAILPRLEAALEGARVGSHKTVVLPPEDAYGRRQPEATLEIERSEFPADVEAGDRYEAETEDGSLIVLRVLEVTPEAVVIDQNHPLAGQRVRFELTVREVRPAREDEVRRAEQRLLADQAGGDGKGAAPSAPSPVIPAQSLLRGPSRSYEKGPAPGPAQAGVNGTPPGRDSEPGNGD
jgi:FKBP-type peptidyl-prolyl cis-trans isomerase SlyD